MPKAVIVHPVIDGIGGAERLAFSFYKALMDLGYTVTMVSRIRGGIEELLEYSGIMKEDLRIIDPGGNTIESILYKASGGRLAEYRRLLLLESAIHIGLSENPDLIVETQSNIPSPVNISYIHFPLTARRIVYGREGPLRGLYEWVCERRARKIAWPKQPPLILTNSTWTRRIIEEVLGRPACVLHPPLRKGVNITGNPVKEDLAVTISRFTPEKKLEKILYIARNIPGLEFRIMGSVHGRSSRKYYEKIAGIAKNLENVTVKANPTNTEILENIARARFYIHPPYIEHFGISVAEASLLGAIPIVYRDGGAWTDIAMRIHQMLGYTNLEEIIDIIRKIMGDPQLEENLRSKAGKIALSFTYESFRRRLSIILEYYNEMIKSNCNII